MRSSKLSSFNDGPLGCFSRPSHFRTVDRLVFNTAACTACVNSFDKVPAACQRRQDDAAQHKKVKALFKTRETFTAPVTVLLELVWVLESRDCSTGQISWGINALLDLPNFKPERADAVREALRHYAAGMGFADSLHRVLSAGDQRFMTFDKTFARQAKKMTLAPEVVLV